MHPIHVAGARTHNLKSVSATFAPGELVAITGPSGAGKSSLAIDTLYAEGQRRFVESFSPYARQFLERLERPPMDALEPVAAGVAVDRRAPVKSSRSTVATMTDVEPYLNALFAREAIPSCPDCGELAVRTDPHVSARRAVKEHAGRRAMVAWRIPVADAERFLEVRETLARDGYRKLLVGRVAKDLDEVGPSAGIVGGAVRVVADRVRLDDAGAPRLAAAIEEASRRGAVELHVEGDDPAGDAVVPLADGLSCPRCARTFEPPRPGLFSYQSPVGACATCRGFGRTMGVDWDKVVPDESRTLEKGAIAPWRGKSSQYERGVLKKYCARLGIPMDRPWSELTAAQRTSVLEGEGTWSQKKYPGVRAWFAWLEGRTYKMHVRVLLSRYRSYDPCVDCGGKRLSRTSLLYRVGGIDLGAFHALELREARAKLESLVCATGQGALARDELLSRLRYLERVGLGYLTLDRQARTLSGGEAQRVSLTAALGTSLTGALFVLDEPTVGLHPCDVPPLVDAMRELARRGNAVLVVEHDPRVVAACDRVLELGPGAGAAGGSVVFDGTPDEARDRADLATGRLLGASAAPARTRRAMAAGDPAALVVKNARGNNLRGLDVRVPLRGVVAVTGPSGSGKSSLVEDVLYRALARARGASDVERPLDHDGIDGAAAVGAVTLVDQAPLGRTSRGNPATYTGAWDRFRALFAAQPEAALRQLGPGHFSFNVAGGRCDACSGEGAETIEMQFLADVSIACPTCRGKRFKDEVLEVRLAGRSVADVLAMSVDEALVAFAREAAIVRALGPVQRLGLGYLALGQPLSTLSGGEAQRLKLARALSEVKKGGLFLLDEPSAGLHRDEVARVVDAMDTLVAAGATVIVVDHDLDVIAAADWVIELGPGAGSQGGTLVAEGPPKAIATLPTATGRALREADLTAVPCDPTAPPPRSMVTAAPCIAVERAREHNLRDVDVTIPHGKLVVFTGPSGSGKSTLAFDVVFAEGQRRFLETLTPYARQFLPTLPRPDVGRVTGVPPSIALEQRTTRSGASSTVATVTEVAHYLRLLYAKVAEPRCPTCDCPVVAQTADAAFGRMRALSGPHLLLGPAVVARKGTYLDVFTAAARAGVTRAIVDGAEGLTDKPPRLKKTQEHDIDLVVAEGEPASFDRASFDRALGFGRGVVKLRPLPKRAGAKVGADVLLSTSRTCARCGTSVPELDPRFFSFHTKQGRCEACEGTGAEDGGTLALADLGDAPACPVCEGSRLAPLPRGFRLAGLRYHEACGKSVAAALRWARTLAFEGDAARIAEAPLRELLRRLAFVEEVGLGYLSLDRRAFTLSGGEMQRLRLAAQLGSGLTGALYVLDEPTIGLHPRDTHRLLRNLRALVDTGSTVLMVEHDADTIRAADHLVDLGPGGGKGGGRIVAEGPPSVVLAHPDSPTARALRDEASIATARACRGGADDGIEIHGARAHNLRVERARFPVGRLTVVAGVSGSGKSTLVQKVLFPAVRAKLGLEAPPAGAFAKLALPKTIQRCVAIDQSPIGRTPRSVPATFLGIFDDVRRLYAACPDAQVRGFGPARFSFNTPNGGRCPACDGQGVVCHEMAFLPDVTTPCEACGGARFEPSTLAVKYNGKSIGDVLAMTATEAAAFFHAHPRIAGPIQTMVDLGVGYLAIGQGSHTLSGGEAQRLKLASELETSYRGKPALYVLDEPTTGLHWSDVARLLAVMDRLVDRGDTLVVIEHHPAVIAAADWLLELGPEGGADGGQLVAEGTPADLAKHDTATGAVLRDLLGGVVSKVTAKKRPRPASATA